ncbi:MAG: hypothetical protein ABIG20_02585 [archaeon]
MGKKDKIEPAEPELKEEKAPKSKKAPEPEEDLSFEKEFASGSPSSLPWWVFPLAIIGLIATSITIIYLQLSGYGVF